MHRFFLIKINVTYYNSRFPWSVAPSTRRTDSRRSPTKYICSTYVFFWYSYGTYIWNTILLQRSTNLIQFSTCRWLPVLLLNYKRQQHPPRTYHDRHTVLTLFCRNGSWKSTSTVRIAICSPLELTNWFKRYSSALASSRPEWFHYFPVSRFSQCHFQFWTCQRYATHHLMLSLGLSYFLYKALRRELSLQ